MTEEEVSRQKETKEEGKNDNKEKDPVSVLAFRGRRFTNPHSSMPN
jgi:hypothetical protein